MSSGTDGMMTEPPRPQVHAPSKPENTWKQSPIPLGLEWALLLETAHKVSLRPLRGPVAMRDGSGRPKVGCTLFPEALEAGLSWEWGFLEVECRRSWYYLSQRPQLGARRCHAD